MDVVSKVATNVEFENTMNKVLQRPSYSHLRYNTGNVIERLKEFLKEWLEKRLDKLFENKPLITTSTADQLSNVFIALGVLLIVALIIVIVVRVNKTIDKSTKIREILGERIDEKTTPTSLRQKAQKFETEGVLRLAIRFDFIALLLLMHNNNLLYLDEAKTNEEFYLALSKRDLTKINEFKVLINIFNNTWYGHKESNGEEYLQWKNKIEELWNEVVDYEEKAK